MSNPLSGRFTLFALLAFTLATALTGCRGRAHDDVYRQKMASEIRVLEDQLYAADYENRVLREKLERERSKAANDSPPSTARPAETQSTPPPRTAPERITTPKPAQRIPDVESLPDMSELDLPEVVPGETVAEPLTDPLDKPKPVPVEVPSNVEILPAPGGPEPPGKNDTNPEEIIPGEILPPPRSPEDVKPPGQIKLPDSVQSGRGLPSKLRIHRTLSGGHRVDGEVRDMMVVVNVVDQVGQPVDVSRFDIDGELSIVILDPEREPDEAKLGRWDFTGPQLAALMQTHPISGIHVPLPWEGDAPHGEEIIVHVRLRGDEDEMRCEGRIPVELEPAVAQWTPRGEAIK